MSFSEYLIQGEKTEGPQYDLPWRERLSSEITLWKWQIGGKYCNLPQYLFASQTSRNQYHTWHLMLCDQSGSTKCCLLQNNSLVSPSQSKGTSTFWTSRIFLWKKRSVKKDRQTPQNLDNTWYYTRLHLYQHKYTLWEECLLKATLLWWTHLNSFCLLLTVVNDER